MSQICKFCMLFWYLNHVSTPIFWMWRVFEGCMCGRGHFEKISFKVFTVHWVVFPLILSNRTFKCTNLYQFWHRNISNIVAPEETWNVNISWLFMYFVNVFNPMLSLSLKWAKLMPGKVNKMCFKHIYSTFQSISVQTHQSLLLIDFNFAKIWKTPSRPPPTDFACSTVSQLQVKTHLVRTDKNNYCIWICTLSWRDQSKVVSRFFFFFF